MKSWTVLTLAFVLASATPAAAQKINAKVTFVNKKLSEQKQQETTDFGNRIQNYINGRAWTNDDYSYEIDCSVQIILNGVGRFGDDDLITATFYITNSKDMQFKDDSWAFVFKQGENFFYNEFIPHSVVSLVDFYLYLLLASEYDTFGLNYGDPFLEKALSLSTSAKNQFFYNSNGWDKRRIEVERLMDEKFKPYRLMKDYYFAGIYYLEEENDVRGAQASIKKAVDMFDGLLSSVSTKNYTERFIKSNYRDIANVFASYKDKSIYNKMIQADPSNKDFYLKYQK